MDSSVATTSSSSKKKKNKSGGFQVMGLSYPILKGVLKSGYRIPTPIQRKTIPVLLSGRDVCAMARTGSGKTAAFLTPVLQGLGDHEPASPGPRALILSPTRELALQTLVFAKQLSKFTSLRVSAILGGDSLESQFAVMHEQHPDLVIATPGRFLHICVEMRLRLDTVRFLVLDEADRLLELGFAEQLREIIARTSESRQTMLFSATLPKMLAEFTSAGLNNPVLIRLDVEKKLSPGLKLVFLECREEDKTAALLLLLQSCIQGRTMVFVATRHHCDLLAAVLESAGIPAAPLHSGLDPTARKITAAKFQNGSVQALVATDLAARGIDIPALNAAINYHFPAQAKLFVHRVGRVARAGLTGVAYSLVAADEMAYVFELRPFLGRPIRFTEAQSGKDEDGLIGVIPRPLLEPEEERVRAIQARDMEGSLRAASNAMKQYKRSRPVPAPASLRESKKIRRARTPMPHPLFGETDAVKGELMDRIRRFKAPLTVLEMFGTADARETMQKKRAAHQKLVRDTAAQPVEAVNLAEPDATCSSHRVGKKPSGRSEFFIPYQSSQQAAERGLAIFEREVQQESLDLAADDERHMGQKKHWDRKRKRFVGPEQTSKKIRTESGGLIPASYKSGIYDKWLKKNRPTEAAAPPGARPGIKNSEQMMKDRRRKRAVKSFQDRRKGRKNKNKRT